MEVVSSVYASAPTEKEAAWAQRWLWRSGKKKIHLGPVGNRTLYNPVRNLFILQATRIKMCVVIIMNSSSIIATFL